MKATSEAAFETLIVDHLTGDDHGYVSRPSSDYDADLALLPADLLGYIEQTQPKSWTKQQSIHGSALRTNLLAAFDKATKDFGVLHVLRHGFKFYGSTLRVATFRPAHGLNPDVEALYKIGRASCRERV